MMNQQNSNTSKSKISVPEAKAALNNMKYEIANELGVNLKQGYNGDLSSREAGYIGGYMVNDMIQSWTFLSITSFLTSPLAKYTVILTFESSILHTEI